MRPISLLVLPLLMCLVASLLWADGGPTVVQTLDRTDMPRAVAVSANGQQIAVVNEIGVSVYRLKSDGTIRDTSPVHSQNIPGLRLVVFVPGGKKIIMVGAAGLLHFLNRDTWELTTINFGLGEFDTPRALAILEDPAILFVTYTFEGWVWAVHYSRAVPTWEKILTGQSPPWAGSIVAARADASRVFCQLRATGSLTGPLYGVPYKNTTGGTWQYQISGDPEGCCVGPDPDHLLVTTREAPGLFIADQRSAAAPLLACHLPDARFPREVALTNDGTYAVVNDYLACTVTAISGADLRGRLDPNFIMPPKGVHTGSVQVAHQMNSLALHPTQPIAYLCSEYGHQIVVVKLAIPGLP